MNADRGDKAIPMVTETHNAFDNSLPAVLTIEPGESVTFDCPGAPMPRGATVADLANIDFSHPHTIVGPVSVAGAVPGDALVIDILDLQLPNDYGHCLFLPELGLLPEEFDTPHVQNLYYEDGYTTIGPHVRVPLRPFCGIMGVAPAEQGSHSTIPPRRVGGNIDIRDLVAGAQLILPIEVEGALFSCGDGHAAQGDGEVCLTAVETAIRPTLQLSLLKGANLDVPRFTAPPRSRSSSAVFGVTAVGTDLLLASKQAVSEMIRYLVTDHGLSREEGYVLCSIAADLHIAQVVNFPNWGVTATIPLDVFC